MLVNNWANLGSAQVADTTNIFIEMRLFIIYLASTFFVLYNFNNTNKHN